MQTKTKTHLSILFVLILLGIAIASFIASRPATIPDNVIKVNGRIEGENHLASTKVSGKVQQVNVAEGSYVKKGDVLALIDSAQVRARVTQAAAAYGATLASYKAAQTALKLVEMQTPIQIEIAQATITYAQAALKAAQANEKLAKNDLRRVKSLYSKRLISKHDVESAELNLKTLHAQTIAAESAVEKARKAFSLANLGWKAFKVKQDEVAAVKASTLQAQASLMEAVSILNDMKIRSPIDGVVTTKLVNEGEVINIGAGLFNIVNLDKLFLKGYIAEQKIGQIHLGLKADIYLDSLPKSPFSSQIKFIASHAEFTPKEVQTQEERVKLVYVIKLYLDENPNYRATPGLPADAYIKLQ